MLRNVAADIRHYHRYFARDKSMWRTLVTIAYKHPASVAVIWFRFGAMAWSVRIPVLRQILQMIYLLVMPLVRTYSGVQIQPQTPIGPGLAILHFGGVVIMKECRIGRNCLLHHNVNIVAMRSQQGPDIGDNFYAGVGAVVTDQVTIQDNVTAGAGCVITKSVPKDAVVAGVPARIIRFREPQENPADNVTLPPHPIGWLVIPEDQRVVTVPAKTITGNGI